MTGVFGLVVPVADTWGMHDGDVGGGWWILMMIGMVAFWAVVISAIVRAARGGLERRSGSSIPAESPLETLDRRLAEGSVTPEEYRERREILERSDDRAAVPS